MASCDAQRIESGFPEHFFYTQDRAKHFTEQYIMGDTSNRVWDKQRSRFEYKLNFTH